MVSHRRLVHLVTRQSRGIVRARDAQPPNIFTRIRVLTPAEINQRLLENWNFIQIETFQQTQYNPLPLVLPPRQFHGAGSPTHDIIEHPIIQDDSVSPTTIGISNSTDPQLDPTPAFSEPTESIPSTSDNFYEDLHDTIPFVNNINFADLINTEDLEDLYDPVAEETQDQHQNNAQDQSLSQLLDEILNDTNYSMDQFQN